MATNPIPKNHHFVAQMHAARFADSQGKLWTYRRESDNIFYAPTKAIFAETHLYGLLPVPKTPS